MWNTKSNITKSDSSRINKVEPLPIGSPYVILEDFCFLERNMIKMAIQYEGLEHFINNNYKKIIIVEKAVNTDYKVHIQENDKINDLDNGYCLNFFEQIKKLPEQKRIEKLIYNFLINHKIVSFQQLQIIPGYRNLFNVISSDDATLAIKLFCDKKILADCAFKYQLDRDSFLEQQSDVNDYEVWLNPTESSYQEQIYSGKRVIKLRLLTKDGNLWWKDKRFFKKWIANKLAEQGVEAKYTHSVQYLCDQGNYVMDSQKLICGNFTVDLTDSLLKHAIKDVVINHNNSLEKEKVLKLKKEVF